MAERLKDLGKVKDSFSLPLDKLIEDPDNERKEFNDLDWLAFSITTSGQHTPIIVRMHEDKQHAMIVAGHRRFRAVKLANEVHGAGITAMTCVSEPRNTTPKDRIIIRLSENIQRDDLKPIEQAAGFKRLRDDHKMTVAEISESIGRSEAYIRSALDLLKAPESVQRATTDGRVCKTAAGIIARGDTEKTAAIVDRLEKGGSVRVVDAERAARGRQSSTPASHIDRMISTAVSRCKEWKEADSEKVYSECELWDRIAQILGHAVRCEDIE